MSRPVHLDVSPSVHQPQLAASAADQQWRTCEHGEGEESFGEADHSNSHPMNSTLVNLRMIRSLPAAYAAFVLLGAQTPTVNQTARRRIRTPPARDRVEHVEGRKLTESLQGGSQGLHP